MKKKPYLGLLGLVLLVACSNDDDPNPLNYAYIPDAAFEKRLIELGIDSDGKRNQQLRLSDAQGVIRLDLSPKSHGEISDLRGIEAFTDLEVLNLTQQNLERINLSKNTQLDSVHLAGNQLKEIDFESNSQLTYADLDANLLERVSGLSAVKNLKQLRLSFNF
jgi:uncharacterized protein YjbI with pentapeptide repeats